MLANIERNRSGSDISDLIFDPDAALNIWIERNALVDSANLTREVAQFLDDIAVSANDWDQDHRDAALSLMQSLANSAGGLPQLDGEQQAEIGKSYIGVVESLDADTDWLGMPWMAMELGYSTAAVMGKEIDFVHGMRLRGQLSEAWSNYFAQVSFKRTSSQRPMTEEGLFRKSLRPQLASLQTKFLARTAEIGEGQIQRSGPSLKVPARELAMWYGQATAKDSSAKLDVLRATPNYLESLKQRGVDVADFWNFNNPETACLAVDAILNQPLAGDLFKTKFAAKTGGQYDATSSDERRALADLNLNLIRDVYADLHGRRTSYDNVQQRINGQIQQAAAVENSRAKLKPVVKWVRQIEPSFNSFDPAEIQAFIDTHQIELQAFHEAKFSAIDTALTTIDNALPPQSSVVRFMERGLYDLKSANLTADCTAWNMEAGFNAWTVPVWVTNPGFNFAYIHSGGTMVAKFGMILGFDAHKKPQVIIDSIETNKNLPETDEAASLEAIYMGFVELQQWSDRNNFGTLQVCTYTNSKELTAELPIIKGGSNTEKKLIGLNFDGLGATKELMDSINPQLEVPEIYLQASAVERDDDGNVLHGEYTPGAELLEEIAKTALARSAEYSGGDDAGSLIDEPHLLTALRSGDQNRIIGGLVAALVPNFAAAFEYDYETLAQLYNNCRTAAIDQNVSIESVFDLVISSFKLTESYKDERPDEYDETLVFMDDDEFEALLAQKAREGRQPRFTGPQYEEQDVDMPADSLAPKALSVLDFDALHEYLAELSDKSAGKNYSHLLDILDQLVLPGTDIAKAAKYVFGVDGAIEGDGLVIPLSSLPHYDRREMSA